MFGWFKKKKEQAGSSVRLLDLNQQPLFDGDRVECLRYEMGESYLRANPEKKGDFYYESAKTGAKVSFLKMIDARSGFQKVRKID